MKLPPPSCTVQARGSHTPASSTAIEVDLRCSVLKRRATPDTSGPAQPASASPDGLLVEPRVYSHPAREHDSVEVSEVLMCKRRRLRGKQCPPMPNSFPSRSRELVRVPCDSLARATSQSVERSSLRVQWWRDDSDCTDGPSTGAGAMECRSRAVASSSTRRPCFAATGLELGTHQRRVLEGRLGALVASEWSSDVTHLVCASFRRTTKLMCAICTGAHIVVPAYLTACEKAGRIVGVTPFILRDRACEVAFAVQHGLPTYSLEVAVDRARRCGPLLRGLAVYCAASVAGRSDLRALVSAAGGLWLCRVPAPAELLNSDGSMAVLLLGRVPRALASDRSVKAFDAELLREAACTQELRYGVHQL